MVSLARWQSLGAVAAIKEGKLAQVIHPPPDASICEQTLLVAGVSLPGSLGRGAKAANGMIWSPACSVSLFNSSLFVYIYIYLFIMIYLFIYLFIYSESFIPSQTQPEAAPGLGLRTVSRRGTRTLLHVGEALLHKAG